MGQAFHFFVESSTSRTWEEGLLLVYCMPIGRLGVVLWGHWEPAISDRTEVLFDLGWGFDCLFFLVTHFLSAALRLGYDIGSARVRAHPSLPLPLVELAIILTKIDLFVTRPFPLLGTCAQP